MKPEISTVARRLYAMDGLALQDFGLTVGDGPNVTPEGLASEVLSVLDALERGDYEVIQDFED